VTHRLRNSQTQKPPRKIFAAILAGGSGERLWPLSRARTPKPLLRLRGARTLLAQVLSRVAAVASRRRTAVIATQDCVAALRRSTGRLPGVTWLAEPAARNTAMCVGLAALWAARQDPAGVIVVLPADQQIQTHRQFAQTLRRAVAAAAGREAIVLLGIRPTRPATEYGYIRRGRRLEPRLYRAAAFREKPRAKLAEALVRRGGWYWNAGIFVAQAGVVLLALRRYLPRVAAGLAELEAAWGTPRFARVLRQVYQRAPKVSFDVGVLQRARHVLVAEAAFAWSDVGSWEAVAARWGRQRVGPAAIGDRGSVVITSDHHLVGLLGTSQLLVVHTPDATLVCDRRRAHELKRLVRRIRARGLTRYL